MQNVLLIIPAGKRPQRAIDAATELARQQGGTLVAVVVLDPSVPSHAARTLTDVGLMGEEVAEQVSEALAHESRTSSEALLHAVAERAKKEGVVVVPIIERGDVGDICRRVVRTHQVGTAVLVAEKRSWFARLLSYRAAQVPALSGCEMRVVEED